MSPKPQPEIDLLALSELLLDAELAFNLLAVIDESIAGQHLATMIKRHRANAAAAHKLRFEITVLLNDQKVQG